LLSSHLRVLCSKIVTTQSNYTSKLWYKDSVYHSPHVDKIGKAKWVDIPTCDSVTIICANKEPVEVIISHTGKLAIQAGYKGYTKTARGGVGWPTVQGRRWIWLLWTFKFSYKSESHRSGYEI
jgi:hypothetical protein